MNTETEITLRSRNYTLDGAELTLARSVVRFIDMMKKGFRTYKNKWMQNHYDECIRWTKYEDLKDAAESVDPTIFNDYQNEISETLDEDDGSYYEVPQDILEDSFWCGAELEEKLDRFVVREGNNEVYYVKK